MNIILILFRSMCFNQRRTEIAVISKNGYIHCWDANKFKQIMSKKLPHTTDTVCLAVDDESTTYAVGSKTNTDLLDARTLQVHNFLCEIEKININFTGKKSYNNIFSWKLKK